MPSPLSFQLCVVRAFPVLVEQRRGCSLASAVSPGLLLHPSRGRSPAPLHLLRLVLWKCYSRCAQPRGLGLLPHTASTCREEPLPRDHGTRILRPHCPVPVCVLGQSFHTGRGKLGTLGITMPLSARSQSRVSLQDMGRLGSIHKATRRPIRRPGMLKGLKAQPLTEYGLNESYSDPRAAPRKPDLERKILLVLGCLGT